MSYKAGEVRKGVPLAALAIALIFLASCASREITVYKFAPPEGTMSTESVYNGQVTLSARYVDVKDRTEYLGSRGYESLGLGLRRVDLAAFVLSVKNGSGKKLIVDPGSIRLATGYGPLLSPYNYANLYLELPRGSNRKATLEGLRKGVVLDKSTTLLPGEAMERLLLFKRPEKVGPEAVILFERLYLGGEETRAALKFLTVDLGR